MTPYFAGGVLLSVLGFLGGLVWFSNRAGRHSAEVSTSERDTANANATTRATQAMLDARTNGVRSVAGLTGELDRGTF